MIYVLGSINMDLVFNVPRMPKSGETLSSDLFNTFCGGKGSNQAIAIARLGSKVAMIGTVGKDSYGKTLTENLKSSNVDVNYVKTKGEDSGLAAILVQKGQNRIILSSGANYRITEEDVDDGLKNAKTGDILLTQFEIPLEIVEYALKKAKSKGMITVVNPAPAKKINDLIYNYIDILTPNETETEILTGINPKGIVEIALAVKKFYQKGVKNVIITLGERGAVVSHGNNITEIDAIKVKVVDTTAAGDTFVGAVLNRLERNWDIVESCRFANSASSITIQALGAADSIPSEQQAEKVYNENYGEKRY